MIKPGYLYVLVHPSHPGLYKVGVTVLAPEKRLAQHNQQLEEAAGQVVKETGQMWALKTFIQVDDPYWAEKQFWLATPNSLFPFGGGVEVQPMDWETVERGLEAAKGAGVRPPPEIPPKPVRNLAWLVKELEGTGITVEGRYRGLVTGVEFHCQRGHRFKESPGLVADKKNCPCCEDWGWLRGPRAGLRPSL